MPENDVLQSYLSKMIGQRVYVLTARYGYVGTLVAYDEQSVLFSNPVVIEHGGDGNKSEPHSITYVGSSILLLLDACEGFCQPKWSQKDFGSSAEESAAAEAKV